MRFDHHFDLEVVEELTVTALPTFEPRHDMAADRHSTLDDLCLNLAKVQYSKALEDTRATDGGLVFLPTWVWLPPARDVGRKAREGNTLPAGISWNVGPVLCLDQEATITIEWRMVGLGYDQSGHTTLSCGTHLEVQFDQDTDVIPSHVTVPYQGAHRNARAVAEACREGHSAQWEFLTYCERWAHRAIAKATHTVEFGLLDVDPIEHDNTTPTLSIIDDTEVDRLTSKLVYGEGDAKDSHMLRLMNRCLKPATFAGVDPLRYVRSSIARDARNLVQQRLGDPRIGSRVRDFYRANDGLSLGELIDEYNAKYPADRLDTKRAVTSLLYSRNVPPVFVSDLVDGSLSGSVGAGGRW